MQDKSIKTCLIVMTCVFCAFFCLTGCGLISIPINGVQVECADPRVETLYFEDHPELLAGPKEERYEAYTTWFFSLIPAFDLAEENVDTTPGATSLDLKVRGIQFKLSCPITVNLSKKAPKETIDHEMGHVELAKRAYGEAESAARKAGEAVMGKRYYGMGKSVEEAHAQALEQIKNDLRFDFQRTALEFAEELSETFDHLTRKNWYEKDVTVQNLVDQAYDKCKNAGVRTIAPEQKLDK